MRCAKAVRVGGREGAMSRTVVGGDPVCFRRMGVPNVVAGT
jgi:hypothetical protein